MGTLCFIYSAQQKKTLDNILGQYQAGCDGLTREEVTRLVDTGRISISEKNRSMSARSLSGSIT